MNDLAEFDTQYQKLSEYHDELVQTVVESVGIMGDLETERSPLNLLLAQARASFEAAAKRMIGTPLDLYSQAGIEQARKLYNDVARYREMVGWIMEAMDTGRTAERARRDVEEQMKDLYEP